MTRKTHRMVLSLLLSSATLAAAPATQPVHRPTLTDAGKQAGWKLIFDGTSTAGWRGLGSDTFPKDEWVVRDGCLVHLPVKGGSNDIVYDRPVENFELSWEWMIPKKNGNSGVKYRVREKKGSGGAFGPEYQMMNDPGVDNKGATGSLYDVLPPKGKELRPDGEFNQSRIVVRGNRVEHWLNGVKVVEYEFGSEALKSAVAESKFKNTPHWGASPKGYIALTDHGDEVWFRNIKLRELSEDGGK